MKIERILPALVSEIIDYFVDHDRHSNRHDGSCLAWNIKVRDFWLKEKHYKEYGLDHKWDNRWDEYERTHDVFWSCCEDGLSFVGDAKRRIDNWTVYPGIEYEYTIWQSGRSGGWLELHEFEGMNMSGFDIIEDLKDIYYTEYDYELQDADDDDDESCIRAKKEAESAGVRAVIDRVIDSFVPLYMFCRSLDDFDASEEYLHQLAFRRNPKEEEWNEKVEELKKERKERQIERSRRKEQRYLFPEEELCRTAVIMT